MHLGMIALALLLAGCAGISPLGDEPVQPLQPDQKSTTVKPAAIPSSNNLPPLASSTDMELRLAKLWARVDDLENQQIRQKERMKLLEKGLMLGLIPEELKSDKPLGKNHADKKSDAEVDELPASLTVGTADLAQTARVPVAGGEKSKDITEYRRLLQMAQDKFNAASYGQAIVHYGEIGEKFDASVTEGSHNYWIGLSWFYLKELQLAEQSFRKLIDHFNQNSWVPYSRYYLAKIDLDRGLSGRARDQFKLLIDEYPNQDLGEMARMEIDRMREKL
jgi:TolA-binding protein